MMHGLGALMSSQSAFVGGGATALAGGGTAPLGGAAGLAGGLGLPGFSQQAPSAAAPAASAAAQQESGARTFLTYMQGSHQQEQLNIGNPDGALHGLFSGASAAGGNITMTRDELLQLVTNTGYAASAKGRGRTATGTARRGGGGGNSSQSQSGGGGARGGRQHRASTSDYFSPQWSRNGEIPKDDKIKTIRTCHLAIDSDHLKNLAEWQLDAVVWRVTGKGPLDKLYSNHKPTRFDSMRMQYIQKGNLLESGSLEAMVVDVLVQTTLMSPLVEAVLTTGVQPQEVTVGPVTVQLTMAPSKSEWKLGKDSEGMSRLLSSVFLFLSMSCASCGLQNWRVFRI